MSVLKWKSCYTQLIEMANKELLNMFTCDFVSEMNEILDNAVKIKQLREKSKLSQDDFARIF